jgi:hypothetical protein
LESASNLVENIKNFINTNKTLAPWYKGLYKTTALKPQINIKITVSKTIELSMCICINHTTTIQNLNLVRTIFKNMGVIKIIIFCLNKKASLKLRIKKKKRYSRRLRRNPPKEEF